jgi:hypothetical protein
MQTLGGATADEMILCFLKAMKSPSGGVDADRLALL